MRGLHHFAFCILHFSFLSTYEKRPDGLGPSGRVLNFGLANQTGSVATAATTAITTTAPTISAAASAVAAASTTVAAPAAATATTAAATATVAAASTTTAVTTSTAAPFFTRTGFVDGERPPLEARAIHFVYGLLGSIRHFHEPEPARPAGFPIGHDLGACHIAKLRERLAEIIRSRLVGQIAHVQILCHSSSFASQKGSCH